MSRASSESEISAIRPAHAVPLALIGVGAGWLILRMRHQRTLKREDTARAERPTTPDAWQVRREQVESREHELSSEGWARAHDMGENVVGKLESLRTRVTQTASDLGQRANALSHDARDQWMSAQHRTAEFAQANPAAVGALAVAAGVGVGLLLPMTRPENRLMGA